jgi:hypothetical protein
MDWHAEIHYAIHSGNWDSVREQISLQQNYKKSLDPTEIKERQTKKNTFWSSMSRRIDNSSGIGLLALDKERRTPLHLALTSKDAPHEILVAIIRLEPKAAGFSNERKRLPLHFAVVHQHHIVVVGELIEAYPRGLAASDAKGKTPLAYAMDLGIKDTDLAKCPITFWMPAEDDTEEGEWQEEQSERWGVVHWLLLSLATHPQAGLSVGGKKPMLVDALLHAAPPAVISLLIGASSMLLSFDNRATAFAGSTLYSCITRHYPLTILMSLAAQCPADIRNVRDETGMGLVAALFISGCFKPGENSEWGPSLAFCAAFDDAVQNSVLGNGVPAFVDWWEKIEFLIAFCSGDKSKGVSREHLLHAALSNSDVPPAVIRLLISLYPQSISRADPKLGVSPLHLAAAGREYMPRQYELQMEGNNKSVLEMIADADPKAITTRHEDRLPLNVAIETGKTFKLLEPLIVPNEISLRQRDLKTKLYPFQQVAMYPNRSDEDSFRWSCIARNKCTHAVWKGLSDREKAAAVYRIVEEESLIRLETIFKILRRQPSVIKPSKPKKVSVSVTRDSSGMGMVAAHYVSWCYKKEEGEWTVNKANTEALQTTIQEALQNGQMGSVSPDFMKWWETMKFWIKYCCPSKCERDGKPFLAPKEDEFLLHAALINSDTPHQIVALLLGLCSASIPYSGHTKLPLHLIAQTTSYTAQPFEAAHRSSLELTMRAYPRAVRVLVEGRLPLHVAIGAGKTWEDLSLIVEEEPRALKVKEFATGLFPFQLMAVHQSYTPEQRLRFYRVAGINVDNANGDFLSAQHVTNEIRKVQKEYQLDVLSSIYNLLRLDPSAAGACDDWVPVDKSLAIRMPSQAVSLVEKREEDEVEENDASAKEEEEEEAAVEDAKEVDEQEEEVEEEEASAKEKEEETAVEEEEKEVEEAEEGIAVDKEEEEAEEEEASVKEEEEEAAVEEEEKEVEEAEEEIAVDEEEEEVEEEEASAKEVEEEAAVEEEKETEEAEEKFAVDEEEKEEASAKEEEEEAAVEEKEEEIAVDEVEEEVASAKEEEEEAAVEEEEKEVEEAEEGIAVDKEEEEVEEEEAPAKEEGEEAAVEEEEKEAEEDEEEEEKFAVDEDEDEEEYEEESEEESEEETEEEEEEEEEDIMALLAKARLRF